MALALSSAACAANAIPASPGATNASSPGPTDTASQVPSDGPNPEASPDATGVLFTVATRGGHCRDGPCGTTVVIDRDGRVHYAAKPPNELGTLSPELLATLNAEIAATDWTELVSHRFNGECPTAYDGQEIVFEFATADGVQHIASCEVEVDYDSALFAAVAEAVGAFMPLPIE